MAAGPTPELCSKARGNGNDPIKQQPGNESGMLPFPLLRLSCSA